MRRIEVRPELLVGRSAEVANRLSEQARELLNRHKRLVGTEGADLIVQREAEMAIKAYARSRIGGHANDDSSLEPGLTAFFTSDGRKTMIMMCKRDDYPIADSQFTEVAPNLISLWLPQGVYRMGGGTAQLYPEANSEYRGKRLFELNYVMLVRIEGDPDHNELWQNWNFR